MQQKTLRSLALSLSLFIGTTVGMTVAEANDLTISPVSSDNTYDPNDPATQVLAIEELDVAD